MSVLDKFQFTNKRGQEKLRIYFYQIEMEIFL